MSKANPSTLPFCFALPCKRHGKEQSKTVPDACCHAERKRRHFVMEQNPSIPPLHTLVAVAWLSKAGERGEGLVQICKTLQGGSSQRRRCFRARNGAQGVSPRDLPISSDICRKENPESVLEIYILILHHPPSPYGVPSPILPSKFGHCSGSPGQSEAAPRSGSHRGSGARGGHGGTGTLHGSGGSGDACRGGACRGGACGCADICLLSRLLLGRPPPQPWPSGLGRNHTLPRLPAGRPEQQFWRRKPRGCLLGPVLLRPSPWPLLLSSGPLRFPSWPQQPLS